MADGDRADKVDSKDIKDEPLQVQPIGNDEVDKYVECSEVVEGDSSLAVLPAKRIKLIHKRQDLIGSASWKGLRSKIEEDVNHYVDDKKQGNQLVAKISKHILDHFPLFGGCTDYGEFQVLLVNNNKRVYFDTHTRQMRIKHSISSDPHVELFDFWLTTSKQDGLVAVKLSAGDFRCAAAYRYVLHLHQPRNRICRVMFEHSSIEEADLISEERKDINNVVKWAFRVNKYGESYYLRPEVDEDNAIIVAENGKDDKGKDISDDKKFVWKKESPLYDICVNITKRN